MVRKDQKVCASPIPPKELIDVALDNDETTSAKIEAGLNELIEHVQCYRKRETKAVEKDLEKQIN